jgi:PAS domain S-box-containing protein
MAIKQEFELFFDYSLDIMVLIGFDNKIELVNPSFERILGWKKEEVISKLFLDFLHPDDRERSLAEAKAHESGSNAVSFENRYRCKDGSYKWISWNSHPITEKQVVIGIGRDITERKKAEEALLYDESLLKGFFDSPGLMRGVVEIINDKDIKHIRDNVVTAKYVGLTPKDLESKLSSELGEPSERIQIWLQHYKEAERNKKPITWEYTDVQGNKQTWLAATVTYIGKAPNGNSQFTYTVLDVTERKKAEEELLAINERFEMAQRAAGVGIWDWDLESGKINWSAEMFRLFGLDPKEKVASLEEWDKVLHPEDKEGAGFKIQQALKEKSFLDNIYRVIRPNGQIVWINALGKGEYNNQGEPIRMTGICVDITARKLAEVRLEEYQKNLEKLVEERTDQLKHSERLAAIGATAGMVGHDIRNPLQAITGDVYLAKTELASMAESEEKLSIQESLTEVEKNIDYINKIVQDLQDYARPLNPNPGEADLKLIIDKLLAKGVPKNIKLNVNLEPEALKLVADADYLNRILYNLITNAIQAMPNGGKLTIHAYREVNDFIITVKDTGVGIPKAIQSKMFTPMFTTKSKGQGFGLPVVKRMTESLGGTVSFESEEGKGTKFIIKLPTNP